MRYEVEVRRTTVRLVKVVVEAADEDEAEEKATDLEGPLGYVQDSEWVLDDEDDEVVSVMED